ncbi:tellurite resistance TerB family protein [Bacterioplanoides pacificum]|uniref:TerB family tellurite resistance protein n=1 Tax=Bacterioplanoides pacificum TaxID=1171596 RepID=A0ABV7VR25_9GAMM
MLNKLLKLFTEPQPQRSEHSLALASAVLMAEVMRADHEIDQLERNAMSQALVESLQLQEEEVRELMDEAIAAADIANDLQQFTRVIHDQCDEQQKFVVVCNLWRIALASDGIDKYEEHIIRRIAELLYLPHSEFIRAKAVAKAEQ